MRNKAITKNGGTDWIPVNWVLEGEMELMAYTCPIRAKSFPGEGPVSTDALRWLRTGMEMG